MHVGAIDAGSNALRAVVGSVDGGEVVDKLASLRIPVRLGHGAFTVGELEQRTIDAAVEAFQRFREMFDTHDVQTYRAVATSALRTARNRDVVLHRIQAEAGIELEVITGREEARLVRRAVMEALEPGEDPGVLLDLGGGSLEVGVLVDDRWRSTSLPVGTVRLLETLGLTGEIGSAEAAMVRHYAATMVRTFSPAVPRPGSAAAACGGNAECYARLLSGSKGRAVEIDALDRLLEQVLPLNVAGRMQAWGVRRDRAEVMGIAGLVLSAAARQLGVPRLIVPHVGLRDAIQLELAEAGPEDALEARARAQLVSARTFAARMGHDIAHGEQVRKHARSLFRGLRELHRLPPACEGLLAVAAVLHDVGEVLQRKKHAAHSAYIVRQASLRGLGRAEQDLVAIVVRLHRGRKPKKYAAYCRLEPERRQVVRRLLALLRVADALDTHRRQLVRRVEVGLEEDRVVLSLDAPGAPADLVEMALRKRKLFEQEFDRRLEARIAAPTNS